MVTLVWATQSLGSTWFNQLSWIVLGKATKSGCHQIRMWSSKVQTQGSRCTKNLRYSQEKSYFSKTKLDPEQKPWNILKPLAVSPNLKNLWGWDPGGPQWLVFTATAKRKMNDFGLPPFQETSMRQAVDRVKSEMEHDCLKPPRSGAPNHLVCWKILQFLNSKKWWYPKIPNFQWFSPVF